MSRRFARMLLACAAVLVPAALAAAADPTPAAKPPKPTTPTKAGPGAHTSGHLPIGLRMLGAWLDDPSILQPGASAIALSYSYWQSPGGSETDVPVADFSAGVGRRLQLQGSVPYAFPSGHGASGSGSALGDVYLGAKLRVAGAPDGNSGVAVMPMLEVLSSFNTPAGEGRAHWVLPVSAQVGTDSVRLCGAAGYFSRGAVFAGASLEGDVTHVVTLAASLSVAHSTQDTSVIEGVGLRRNEVDVSGGAYFTLSPRVGVFASVGRTISQLDAESTRLLLSSGVSITFGEK